MNTESSTAPAQSEDLLSLLLEIGTEEIPARFLPPALEALAQNTTSAFKEHLVAFAELKTYATPRRLALIVRGIPAMQGDLVKEVFGPSRKVAYDDMGNPTKAALGFAQSQGVSVSDLAVRSKDKGEYVVAVIQQKGVAVRDMLPNLLRQIVLSLSFPKSMRWGYGSLRFARPIHWILALLNGETVPVDIEGIRSGTVTKGHRFLSPGTFVVKEIPTYKNLLENNYVIVDQEERRSLIEKGLTSLASSVGGTVLEDKGLVDIVTYLVEYPVPVLCEFPAHYLRLPKELLITVMRDHQKYFAVQDINGSLKNYFVVISNTKGENAPTIRIGAERVIKARFEDARFYYEEDVKKPLHARIEDLKRVTFHDKLGSLYDKTGRIVTVASFLSEILIPEQKKRVERVAWLSKTDLITGVVKEFPELQGLMGRYYALHDGEDRVTADAIEQHYLPAHSGDNIPDTDEGAVVSLADKIDNVVSFFGAGMLPTGSEDPFALRRQALAVIAILMEKGYNITLREIITKTGEGLLGARPSLLDEVLGFISQRLEPLLASQNFDADIVQSLIHLIGDVPLFEMKERMAAIKKFTTDSAFQGFLLAMKRIHNIIPHEKLPALRQDLLYEPQEKTLYSDLEGTKAVFAALVKERKIQDALRLIATLTPSISAFFDNVLVMDKREDVKMNRLSLLSEIRSRASSIADFSKLAENR